MPDPDNPSPLTLSASMTEMPKEEMGGWQDPMDEEHKRGLTEMYERIAELEHSQSQLKKMNEEMRCLLETADDEVTELLSRNATLTNQVKMLERSISDMEQVEEDLCEVRRLLANEQSKNNSKEKEIHKLEKEQKNFREQDEKITAELNRLQHQRQQDEINICNLRAGLQTLQQQMEETKLELKQRDEIIHQQNWQLKELEEAREESSCTIKDLRLRIQDLKSQLEMHQEDASCVGQNKLIAVEDGSPGRPLSFAEEMDFLTSSLVEDTEVEEQGEWVKQDAVEVQVESVGQDKSVAVEGCSPGHTLSFAEEIDFQASSLVEDAKVEEQRELVKRDTVKLQVKGHWHTCIRHLVKWSWVTGIITLAVLILLSLMTYVALETSQQNSKDIYPKTLTTISYTVIQRYCSVQHVDPPPV